VFVAAGFRRVVFVAPLVKNIGNRRSISAAQAQKEHHSKEEATKCKRKMKSPPQNSTNTLEEQSVNQERQL